MTEVLRVVGIVLIMLGGVACSQVIFRNGVVRGCGMFVLTLALLVAGQRLLRMAWGL